jgi:D-serine deaminase-like pyridoxal phosphate-dependent protein
MTRTLPCTWSEAMLASDMLADLATPCLVLDEAKMLRNIARLRERLSPLGVALRPHLKTAKSVEVARRVLSGGNGPATVSTLKEAEVFAGAGVTDILYAVGIAPQKLARVLGLRAAGCDLCVILDTQEQALAVAEASRASGTAIPALIEIDCDGHRGGLKPGDPDIAELGRILHQGGAELRGVMTHAGGSYEAVGAAAHAVLAEEERRAVVRAADILRQAGLPSPVVSVGATPTAHAVNDLSGVTEVRPGVYVFFDLVMAGIGVCGIADIALSVLTTVIGHQRASGRIIVDAGWMAMSRDRGTASQSVDQGYGLVCDVAGNVIDDLVMTAANQEHGLVSLRPGSLAALPDLPVGSRLRILPNHACATASQFSAYEVLPAEAGGQMVRWPRFGGW